MKMLNGRLDITKQNGNMHIILEDDNSTNGVVEIVIGFADLMQALTGLAGRPVQFTLCGNPETIGKVMINDEIQFKIDHSVYSSDAKRIAAEEAKKHVPEGWTLSDTFGSQKSIMSHPTDRSRSIVTANIIKFVDANSPEGIEKMEDRYKWRSR